MTFAESASLEPLSGEAMAELKLALRQGNFSLCTEALAGRSSMEMIDGVPALGWAVESGSADLVRWLLDKPECKVDGPDLEGRTPLMRLLGPEVSDLDSSARRKIVQLLIRRGADPMRSDAWGESAQKLAETSFPELVGELRPAPLAPSVSPLPPVVKVERASQLGSSTKPFSGCFPLGIIGFFSLALLFCISSAPPRRSALRQSAIHQAVRPRQARNRAAERRIQRLARQPQVGPQAPNGRSLTYRSGDWKKDFEAARAAWNSHLYRNAANSAQVALEEDSAEQPKKGEVYALAVRARVQLEELTAARALLRECGGVVPYNVTLTNELAADLKMQVANVTSEARVAYDEGSFARAHSRLEVAQRTAALLSLPASPQMQALQQQIEQRELATQKQSMVLRAEHRARRTIEVVATPSAVVSPPRPVVATPSPG